MFRSSRQALPTQRFQLARSGHFGRRRRRLRGQDVVPLEEPADALAVRPLRVDLDRTTWFLWFFRTQTRGLQRSRKEQKQRRKNAFFLDSLSGKKFVPPCGDRELEGKNVGRMRPSLMRPRTRRRGPPSPPSPSCAAPFFPHGITVWGGTNYCESRDALIDLRTKSQSILHARPFIRRLLFTRTEPSTLGEQSRSPALFCAQPGPAAPAPPGSPARPSPCEKHPLPTRTLWRQRAPNLRNSSPRIRVLPSN